LRTIKKYSLLRVTRSPKKPGDVKSGTRQQRRTGARKADVVKLVGRADELTAAADEKKTKEPGESISRTKK